MDPHSNENFAHSSRDSMPLLSRPDDYWDHEETSTPRNSSVESPNNQEIASYGFLPGKPLTFKPQSKLPPERTIISRGESCGYTPPNSPARTPIQASTDDTAFPKRSQTASIEILSLPEPVSAPTRPRTQYSAFPYQNSLISSQSLARLPTPPPPPPKVLDVLPFTRPASAVQTPQPDPDPSYFKFHCNSTDCKLTTSDVYDEALRANWSNQTDFRVYSYAAAPMTPPATPRSHIQDVSATPPTSRSSEDRSAFDWHDEEDEDSNGSVYFSKLKLPRFSSAARRGSSTDSGSRYGGSIEKQKPNGKTGWTEDALRKTVRLLNCFSARS